MTLLSILVGWALGLLSALFAQWISTLVQRHKTAQLLLQEVKCNKRALEDYVTTARDLEETGKIYVDELVSDEEGPVDPAEGDISVYRTSDFTTVHSTTLPKQGVLTDDTLSLLHRYYRRVRAVETYLDRLEAEEEHSKQHRWIQKVGREAEQALEHSEDLTGKLKKETNWLLQNP